MDLLTQYRNSLHTHLKQWEAFVPHACSPTAALAVGQALFKIPHAHPENQSWPPGVRQTIAHPHAVHPIEQLYGFHMHLVTSLVLSPDETIHAVLRQWFDHANITPSNVRLPLGRDFCWSFC